MFIRPAEIICKFRGHNYETMHMLNSTTHEKTGEVRMCTRCGAIDEEARKDPWRPLDE